MAGWTNKGKYRMLGFALRGDSLPTNWYVNLVTSATAPDADTNVLGDLTEIAAGNGYTSNTNPLTANAVDFDVWTEDDGNDLALVELRDIVWTASGGAIPDSGDGARYAVLTDDNATVASREVYFFWDLTSNRSVSSGQTLTLQDSTIRITE